MIFPIDTNGAENSLPLWAVLMITLGILFLVWLALTVVSWTTEHSNKSFLWVVKRQIAFIRRLRIT